MSSFPNCISDTVITYLPNRISDTSLPHEHDVQAARPVRAEHDRLLDVAGT